MENLLNKILLLKPVVLSIALSRKVVVPFFDGLPLFDVIVFFLKGLKNGALTSRASAISFSFFLAVFPTIIFFFTLIAYIPIDNFQLAVMDLLKEIIPQQSYDVVKTTLNDIISRQRGGLLSMGFIFAMYFSTNGIAAIIEGFNRTYHAVETRSIIMQRLISLLLVLILSVMMMFAIILIIGSSTISNYLVEYGILQQNWLFYLLMFFKWIVVIALCFFCFSFIFYLGPVKKTRFRFISAGASLATLLSIFTSVGFNFYINNFSKYNALYGSIGTLIIIMMWIYFNSIILLIGFELNVSIYSAKQRRKLVV